MTIPGILAWVDEHSRLTGRWSQYDSEPEGLPIGKTWYAVQSALTKGLRGLPGGSSLARLLAEHRELRGALTPKRILDWADARHAVTGHWPVEESGQVSGAPGETWKAISGALANGDRALPGLSSLGPRLLAERPGERTPKGLPLLTIEQIRAWAEADCAATGRRPSGSGPIPGAPVPGETWAAINRTLWRAYGRLPGGRTLA